jgi:hypothetical protein
MSCMCISLCALNCSMLSTMNDCNENKNSLTSGNMFNFLNNFTSRDFFLTSTITLMVLPWILNIILFLF